MKIYEAGIARRSHVAYYQTAELFLGLAKETSDDAYSTKALACFSSAIEEATKLSDEGKLALYLADRSKLYLDRGELGLAVQDLKRAAALPEEDDGIGMYTESTIKDIIKSLTPEAEYSAAIAAGESTQAIIAKLEKNIDQPEKHAGAAAGVAAPSPEVLSAAAGIGAEARSALAAQDAISLPKAPGGPKPASAPGRQ